MVRASAIAAPAVKTASTSASGINFLILSSLSRHRSERVYVEIGWSLCSAQNGMLHCNNNVGRGGKPSSFRNNRWTNRAALIRATALHPARPTRDVAGKLGGRFQQNRMVFVATVREARVEIETRSQDRPPPLAARQWQGRNAAEILRHATGRASPEAMTALRTQRV